MNGKEFRLARFLGRSDKLVVAAIDHGGFMGPIPGIMDPDDTCTKLTAADAVLMMPGMIHRVAHHLSPAGSPLLITRLLWQTAYCFQWKYRESRHASMLSVSDAVALGADVVLASLSLNTGCESGDAHNVALFSECVHQAERAGVPIIGEYYPAAAEDMTPEQLHENIKIGCRVIAELGADMIKTFYTGKKFGDIVAATPAPILVLGAEKTPTERDALKLALNAASAGARGIVFGRNIVQSRNPAGFVKAVRSVMKNEASVEDALKAHNLN